MLGSFRKLANTWPARIFLVILGVSFASWGVADVARRIAGGGNDVVAVVEGHDITPAAFMDEFRADMQRYAERFPDPSQIPASLRIEVAEQTLTKMVTQQALADQAHRMGIVVPDQQVRDAVFAMPDFQGPDGKFNRNILLQTLAGHSMTEAHFLDLVRMDIRQNQLLNTVAASAAPSKLLTDLVYKYVNEKRLADVLVLPFIGQPLPGAPPDAVLRRYDDNNPKRYSAPEYRHVKVVILSPDSIGRGLTVPDSDMQAWFGQHKAEFVAPEKRSLQVITTDTEAEAAALAAQWKAGADWDAMQAAARAAHATPVALDNATPDQIPSPDLAAAAFAAVPQAVTGPIKQPLGYYVLRVASVTPARNPSFESLRPVIRDRVAAEKAMDLIDARAQKLQDLFAGGAKIDEVPADLGATGAEGTLDSQGNTPEGTPAPIPAAADLRQQIVAAAFAAKIGDPIQPTEGPNHSWYAVSVDKIIPPARKPFDQIRDQLLLDWQRDQVHRHQEVEATRLLQLVKSGQSLTNAAWGSGLQVTRTPPLVRNRPQAGMKAQMVQTLFTLAPGQATMAETEKGFVVAQMVQVVAPDAKADSSGLAQTQAGLKQALHDDYVQMYALALKDAAQPTIRPDVVESLITQQPGQ
jgi:peptidyl-prolyl cis-trans isomerase D